MTNYRRKTIDDFVFDEVHVCASHLVSEIIQVRNLHMVDGLRDFDYDNIEWPIDKETDEPREVFEWWFISSWLADKLQAQNECIIRAGFVNIWGRTCTGQGVAMDSVIEDIYRAVMEA